MISAIFGLFSTDFYILIMVLCAAATAGVIATLVWCPGIWAPKEKKPYYVSSLPTEEQQKLIDLAEASEAWTGVKSIPLSQVAPIWTTKVEDKRKVVRPTFAHASIEAFYAECIDAKKAISGVRKTIINKILLELDVFGDCSSVVKNNVIADPDNDYKIDLFKLLSRVTLLDHSLGVARAMAKLITKDSHLADSFIVALGHDLGKLPKWHDSLYRTGNHPRLSTSALDEIPEFLALPNYLSLRNTVAEHHLLTTKNGLTTRLKECDMTVRNQEESLMGRLVVKEAESAKILAAANPPSTEAEELEEENGTPGEAIPVGKKPSVKTAESNSDLVVGWQQEILNITPPEEIHYPQYAPDPVMQNSSPDAIAAADRDAYRPKRVAIPWFDAETFLAELKTEINVVVGKQWGALSMPDGLVYVTPNCIWDVLLRIAPEDVKNSLMIAAADGSSKEDLLYSTVWKLGEEHHATMIEYMGPSYYRIQTKTIDANEKEILSRSGRPLYLVPFKAEAFGALASDLEATKTNAVFRVVKKITPLVHESLRRKP